MDVTQAIKTMRAVREFAPEQLADDRVLAILNAGRRAQSSKNTQPWQFVAIRDRQTLQRLSECGNYAGHLAGAALGVALVTSESWDFDIGQAAAFMQLEAWSLGVGSCLAAMWEPERAKEILGIPEQMHFRIAISFGYPKDADIRRAPRQGGRRALDELVHWDRW